ncbi:hypothetical protein CFN78_16465 [Amycolatopsis antarctica]|uniref:PPE family domain-containing protein n=1 Tax=Amycolatopsis antarctica TaxID=1854586 RepID=A0A263D126_9PSEU|nr:WXG100 family type VII secretion target [Amycolatopsis antarctica]OZM72132.1 hypothetical protein CFN78_16465 [Amycolatopsis antarctica]
MPDDDDRYDGNGFSSTDNGIFADLNSSTGVADYAQWDWKQIAAAITGGTNMTGDGAEAMATAVSSPDSLRQAATVFSQVQATLTGVAEALTAQAEAVAGRPTSPWQGPAAETFLAMMRQFSAGVGTNADRLGGGDARVNAVPQQLLDNANALTRAIANVHAIDAHYASEARRVGVTPMSNGLIPVSRRPDIVELLNADMRTQLDMLVGNYSVTVVPRTAPVQPPIGIGGTASGLGGSPSGLTSEDLLAGGLGGSDAGGGPVTEFDPASVGLGGDLGGGAGAGLSAEDFGVGELTPFASADGLGAAGIGGDLGAGGEATPFSSTDGSGALGAPSPVSPFGGLGGDLGGGAGAGLSAEDFGMGAVSPFGGLGDAGSGLGLGVVSPFGGLGASPGAGAGSGADTRSGLGSAPGLGGKVDPALDRQLNPVSPFEPGQFDDAALGGGAGGIGDLGAGGIGDVSPFTGAADVDAVAAGDVGSAGDVGGAGGADADRPAEVPTASDAGASSAAADQATGAGQQGMGGMPFMPPTGGMGGMPANQQAGADRSDASGLIEGDSEPWVETSPLYDATMDDVLSGENITGATAGTGALSGLTGSDDAVERLDDVGVALTAAAPSLTTGGPSAAPVDDWSEVAQAPASDAVPTAGETATAAAGITEQPDAATALGTAAMAAAGLAGVAGARSGRRRKDETGGDDSSNPPPEPQDVSRVVGPPAAESDAVRPDGANAWDGAGQSGPGWTLGRVAEDGQPDEQAVSPVTARNEGENDGRQRSTWKPTKVQSVEFDLAAMPRSGDWDGVEEEEDESEAKPETEDKPPAAGGPTKFAMLLNEDGGSWRGKDRITPGVLE